MTRRETPCSINPEPFQKLFRGFPGRNAEERREAAQQEAKGICADCVQIDWCEATNRDLVSEDWMDAVVFGKTVQEIMAEKGADSTGDIKEIN